MSERKEAWKHPLIGGEIAMYLTQDEVALTERSDQCLIPGMEPATCIPCAEGQISYSSARVEWPITQLPTSYLSSLYLPSTLH